MKYMLVMNTLPEESEKLSENEIKAIEKKHKQFRQKYKKSQTLLNGAGLHFRKDSLAIEMHEGKLKVDQATANGSNNEMTAYYVVECDNDEQAQTIASELLDDHVVKIEIRQIHHSSGM